MRVLTVNPDLLGPIVLRQVPELRPSDEGEAVYIGRVVIPGKRVPAEVRLRTKVAYSGAAGIVTCHGACRVTAWYMPRGRGKDARSEVTLSVDEIRSAPGRTPDLVGRDLPVELPVADLLLLSVVGNRAAVMLPADVFDGGGGVVEVTCDSIASDVAVGLPVRLIGVQGNVRLVDREDVGQYAKARVELSAFRIEPALLASVNGRARRDAPAPAPAEGGDQ